MTLDRKSEALSRMGELSAPPEDASTAAARRKRVVGSIASSIRRESDARATRASRARIAWAVGAAAAITLVAGASWRLGAGVAPPARLAGAVGGVVVTHEGQTKTVASDMPLASDDEIATLPDAHARLLLESGAAVEVAEGTRVHLERGAKRNERVRIGTGEIVVRVPKLGTGESFRVETPDAEVTVHGTSFVVTVREGHTRVNVHEGIVSVSSAGQETFLHAGDVWPAPSAASPTPPPSVAAPASSSLAPSPAPLESANGRRIESPRPASPKPETSTLGEQNRLLQQGLDARRRGDDSEAIASFDKLLARYPRSPLAQEARVEKFRALERRGDHARALAEAQRYIADYPSGFAVAEAKALISR